MAISSNELTAVTTKIFVTAVVVNLLVGCAQIEPTDGVTRPEIKEGESWTYAVVTVNVRESPQKRREFSVTRKVEKVTDTEIWVREGSAAYGAREVQIKFDKQWNRIEGPSRDDGSVVRFDPHLPTFAFPLAPNQSWTRNFIAVKVDSQEFGQHGQSQGKVLGWEEVSVPAGHFKALRIETLTPYHTDQRKRNVFVDPKLRGGAQEQYWYVPELKNFVKRTRRDYVAGEQTGSSEMELIGYRLEDRK